MRRVGLLFLAFVVCFTPFPAAAIADNRCTSRFCVFGGVPEPEAPDETVRLDSGEVTIRWGYISYSVNAVYEFFNTGDTRTQRVGIPLLVKRTYRGNCPETVRLHPNSNLDPSASVTTGPIVGLHALEVRVDGRKVELTEERNFLKTQGSSQNQVDGNYGPEPRWMVTDVTFRGNAKTTIRCEYSAPFIGSAYKVLFGHGTGRAWKGRVGKLVFIIDSSDVPAKKKANIWMKNGDPADLWESLRSTNNITVMERCAFEPKRRARLSGDIDCRYISLFGP